MNKTINWEIQQKSIADFQSGEQIPGWKRILRVNPNQKETTFHVAKDSYNPPTIKEFKGYYEKLQKITGFEAAGFQEWNNGKLVFGYLKNNQKKFDINGHFIEDYLLISVGFCGNNSFSIGSVNKLLRCQNEFGNINKVWKVRNTQNRELRTDELLESFEQHILVRNLMFDSFKQFQKVKIDQGIINECKRTLMGMEKDETIQDLGTAKKNQYQKLSSAIATEIGSLDKNLWGLFNGVTKHTTWNLSKEKQERNLFGNVVQGESRYKMNKSAFDFCQKYAENENGILLATS